MSKIMNKRILKFSLFIILLGVLTTTSWNATQTVKAETNSYYVSPSGDDLNEGTEESPWKTLKKAAITLKAGDTAIFEDGIYTSNETISFVNTGTSEAPITIRARNNQKATLMFTELTNRDKIVLENKEHIIIKNFEITQQNQGTNSADILIRLKDCNHCVVTENSIHNASGKAIQANQGDDIVITNNEIFHTNHHGIYLSNTNRPIVANNELRELNTNGIAVGAGTKSAQIYNNYIHATETVMNSAIQFGGNNLTGPDGYEAYNGNAWNNIIVSHAPGSIKHGLSFFGSENSAFYHNVIVDVDHGVWFEKGGSSSWRPQTANAKVMNNIFSGCRISAHKGAGTALDTISDYNVYHNCSEAPLEPNSVYENPMFVNRVNNWHLQLNSPALNNGTALSVTGYYNEPIDVHLDYNGIPRTEPIHMGIYSDTPIELGDVLFYDDFESGDHAWTSQTGSLSIVLDEPGNHVLTLDENLVTNVARSHAGSMEWESYVFETQVKFNEFFHSLGWLTLYARYLDINNYYLLEIQGDPSSLGYIALKKKVDGVVIPLQEITGWHPPMTEWVNLKLVINGSSIEVYFNDELLLSGIDYELEKGAIAAAIYQSSIYIDDVNVTEITNPNDDGGNLPPELEPGSTYYVSPFGSDVNIGSESEPWKTMAKAAETAQRGDTVIFEDGVYHETRAVVFRRGGIENEQIVFKARNKHQAIIVLDNLPTTKILLRETPYITIQDFEITQSTRGTTTSDIFIQVREGSDHVSIIGNKIHNAFEEGVKASKVSHLLIENNQIYNMNHEAIDVLNVESSVIRNNHISEIGRVGIMVKGGARDVEVYNNLIKNESVYMRDAGITIGGLTISSSAYDPTISGYEAWNIVAYNNVIISKIVSDSPMINRGIAFYGAKNSATYNNIIVGTNSGVFLEAPIHTPHGWDWDPDNINPVIMNNIITNTTGEAIKLAGNKPPVNMQNDYNLYYDNAIMPIETEPNGVYADPLFVDVGEGNYRLMDESPAIAAGTKITHFTLKNGETIDISLDVEGTPRDDVWDLGIYKYVLVDLNPPIWPANEGLTLSNLTHSSVKLTWPEAIDNVDVTGYRIYVNDDELTDVTGTVNEQVIGELVANTNYKFKVIAYDDAGNESSPLIVFATTSSGSSGSSQYSSGAYLSSNAYLNSLAVNIDGEAISLNPIFTEEQTNYTVKTDANQAEILFSPSHFAAKVSLKGEVVNQSVVVDLEEGKNVFELIVQAENGTSKTYTLTIQRESSDFEFVIPKVSLTDLDGHWAESSIMQAILEGIASGYPDNTFRPNNPITRAEFTVMLMNTLVDKSIQLEETTLSAFTDQAQIGDWAQSAISNAVQKGIIQGYTDGQFRPNAQITRAEMTVMIARALNLQLSTNSETAFKDNADIPSWAKAAIETIHELGIVNGREQNMFVPNETATRAEATTMLLRLFNHVRSI